jgi:hypothetical protein
MSSVEPNGQLLDIVALGWQVDVQTRHKFCVKKVFAGHPHLALPVAELDSNAHVWHGMHCDISVAAVVGKNVFAGHCVQNEPMGVSE